MYDACALYQPTKLRAAFIRWCWWCRGCELLQRHSDINVRDAAGINHIGKVYCGNFDCKTERNWVESNSWISLCCNCFNNSNFVFFPLRQIISLGVVFAIIYHCTLQTTKMILAYNSCLSRYESLAGMGLIINVVVCPMRSHNFNIKLPICELFSKTRKWINVTLGNDPVYWLLTFGIRMDIGKSAGDWNKLMVKAKL